MSKLTERAMLTTLRISRWGGMMVDREVTDAVNADFKAQTEAGRYNKRLVKSSFFSGVSTAATQAQKTHQLMTLPWEDGGTRILANTTFLKYQQKMRLAHDKFDDEVKLFIGDLDNAIIEAKSRLGDMFDPDDYPTKDELVDKFKLDVEIGQVPEAADFRVKLSDEQTKSIMKDIERRTDQRLKKAADDIFIRVQTLVQTLSSKLRDYVPPKDGARATGIIRDTLVYNISELADFLPDLNVMDDDRITKLATQLKGDLIEHSPEILRADEKARKQTISKADAILKKLDAYLK